MKFTVKNWMNDLVIFVDPDMSVLDALGLMRRRYVNSVIVRKTESNPEYGIVTSTDICDKIVAHNNNPAETKIREIMNSPLITVTSDMPVQECAAKMKEYHIHHLPVVDSDGNVIGMISATDFMVVAEGLGTQFQDRSLR
jgi:CBS domain-containing protein